MMLAFTIASVIYAVIVLFWLLRMLTCVAFKEPKNRVVIWLQMNFFSLCFADGEEIAWTALVYISAAFLAFLTGFHVAGYAMLAYLALQLIQWLYVNTEANRKHYDEMLFADELVACAI